MKNIESIKDERIDKFSKLFNRVFDKCLSDYEKCNEIPEGIALNIYNVKADI